MKALVFEGKVVQVSEKEFPVHESMIWVDCDETVKAGYIYDGCFSPEVMPENPSIPDQTPEEKLASLEARLLEISEQIATLRSTL